jgi:hypothetical protein
MTIQSQRYRLGRYEVEFCFGRTFEEYNTLSNGEVVVPGVHRGALEPMTLERKMPRLANTVQSPPDHGIMSQTTNMSRERERLVGATRAYETSEV